MMFSTGTMIFAKALIDKRDILSATGIFNKISSDSIY